MSKKIAKVVVGLPLDESFDYEVPLEFQDAISLGSRVFIPFGKRRVIGFVVGFASKSRFKELKPLISLLDNIPSLDANTLKLTKEFSQYYGCSWGEAIQTSLPSALRRKKILPLSFDKAKKKASCKPETIFCHDKGTKKRWDFITGKIEEALGKEEGVIFLVPEIALVKKAKQILGQSLSTSVSVLDKKLSAKQELEEWMRLKERKSSVVVGTRSSVFAPVDNLGLIIVYEEENASYKQEQSPFYHVRDVVLMRVKIEGCSLLFMSSAPTAELWKMARKKNVIKKVFEEENRSEFQLIDLSNYKPRDKSSLSYPLQNDLYSELKQGGRVMLFLNRRGFSSITKCNQCGFSLKCERCNTNFSYLYSKKKLVCRHCGSKMDLPKVCPACNGSYLRSMGGGIEKVESDLARLIPGIKIAKYDGETAKVPSDANVIIATQAILKCLDKVNIDLIGVLDVDSELNRFDFRSAQRVFSLLVRLRQAARKKVVVQTYQMKNYALLAVRELNFEKFYRKELKLRKELGFPPFSHLVSVVLRGLKEDVVFEESNRLFEELKNKKDENMEILDPQPDVIHKLRDKYRFTIMLKGKKINSMLSLIKTVSRKFKKKYGIVITVNVDP